MGYNPIVFFWKVTFKDGSELQQYDLQTGKESVLSAETQKEIVTFAWCSFSQEFGKFLIEKGHAEVYPIFSLPTYTIHLTENQRIVWARRNHVMHEEFRKCPSCQRNFTWKNPFELTKCPQCGKQNYYVCEKCESQYYDLNEIPQLLCPKCAHALTRIVVIEEHSREKRFTEYLLGYQETIENENHQTVIFIQENGNCTVRSKVHKGGEWSR